VVCPLFRWNPQFALISLGQYISEGNNVP
jgi:hypothetical protein